MIDYIRLIFEHLYGAPDLSEAKSGVVDACSTNQQTPTNTAFITQKPNILQYELPRPDNQYNPCLTYTPHPKRFDNIGDVVVISIPSEHDNFKNEIAKTIVSRFGCPDDQRLQTWSSLPF